MSTATANDWRTTYHSLCDRGVLASVPRCPTVSAKGLVLRCLRTLDELGYELIHLECLSDLHLQALARFWLHTDSPELKRNARLQALYAFVGTLSGRTPRNGLSAHVGCARAVLAACRDTRALCWSAIGIDVDGMLRRIELQDPYVALQLSLQRMFGLTVTEVLAVRPHDADRGNCLVVAGDLGARRIAIETSEQRRVLDAAKVLAPYPGAPLHAVGTPACDVPNRYHTASFEAGFSLWELRLRAHCIRFERRFADVVSVAAAPQAAETAR